ncbi:sporulation histidine kinase inhibitor Sda [Alkalihalobacillus sp. MEB130]|uniref:sporulation histidine kinase inhibitor Sda n=1 Tax=Alkalihalobacillus sp. MEB130 TaxID=2976704 RepID=UPI0028DDD3F1|nr:sporulation histidine kinase inhibitor Sda [Alkalihalobacillus sp. MEB130]MDT8858847.1 sporulation histidine kinase inhibitor Sda [Alkalihalobacillus sp. MEB130]
MQDTTNHKGLGLATLDIELLHEAYKKANKLQLDQDFIELLKEEISQREKANK